jgi:hypothetical protein
VNIDSHVPRSAVADAGPTAEADVDLFVEGIARPSAEGVTNGIAVQGEAELTPC